MTRRITAFIGIIVMVALALALMWRVYLHHRAGGDEDEPGVIASRKSNDLQVLNFGIPSANNIDYETDGRRHDSRLFADDPGVRSAIDRS